MPANPDDGPILDQIVIASLRQLGNETFQEIFHSFLQDLPKRIVTLDGLVCSGPCDTLAKTFHSLKGVLGTLGARRLYLQAAHLDHLARSGNLIGIQQRWPNFKIVCSATLCAMEEIVDHDGFPD